MGSTKSRSNCKGVCIVAEVNPEATYKRHEQGWVDEVYKDLDHLIDRAQS